MFFSKFFSSEDVKVFNAVVGIVLIIMGAIVYNTASQLGTTECLISIIAGNNPPQFHLWGILIGGAGAWMIVSEVFRQS